MSPPLDAATEAAAAGAKDWITAPVPDMPGTIPAALRARAADAQDWVTVPQPEQAKPSPSLDAAPSGPAPQQPLQGIGNALAQGFTRGLGSMIGGAGQQVGTVASYTGAARAQQQLATIADIDAGKAVPDQSDPLGYQYLSPEQRAKVRVDLQTAVDNEGPEAPNAVTRFGTSIKDAATTVFPVAPENEGHATNVARMVGGFVPALGASAVGTLAGGPIGGVLAGAAIIGSQTYNDTYDDAIAHGASHRDADLAAGRSAEFQMATMSIPLGKALSFVPVPLREGFLKTVAKAGLSGVEMSSANALGTLAQNYVAASTYDPERSLFKGTGDATIDGFLAGLFIHAGRSALPAATQPGHAADQIMRAGSIDEAINTASQAASGTASGAGGAGGGASGEGGGAPRQPTWGEIYNQHPSPNDSAVLTTAAGTKHPYRYEVVEAGDLTPASGDLQPRDRDGRVASSGQISTIARNLDPELLHLSSGPDQGAPTVDGNGTILAGNGRTRALRLAYANGTADPYRAMLERYGFDTSNMNEPVLIRRLSDPMTPDQARQFAIDSNVQSGQRLSGTEQAAIDARGLTPDMLGGYNADLTGGPVAAGNRDFVRRWVATLPESERNSVMDANGVLSADGQRRLQGAMLSLAYGDKGTLARSLESTDDTTRSLTGALTDAAPAFAQLQAAIASGQVPPELNIAPQLIRAMDIVRTAREKGQAIGDALRQGDALDPIDPVTEGLVRVMYNANMTRQASRASVADTLRRYASQAGQASTGPGLFGEDMAPVDPADVLARAHEKARTEPTPIPNATVAEQAAAMGIRPQRVEVAAPVADNAEPGTFSVGDRVVTSNGPGTINGTTTRTLGDEPAQTTHSVKFDRGGRGDFAPDELSPEAAAQPTEAAGAQVSTAAQARMAQEDFLDNRLQGEIERLAAPPRLNDSTVYIPGVRHTLAEQTGDPQVAGEQQYNSQQPGAAQLHKDRTRLTGDTVAEYWGDTAESAARLRRLKRDRETNAQANTQAVFGADDSARPPADTSPTVRLIQGFTSSPRQQERTAVNPTITKLLEKFYDEDGNLKTDPLRLYGIGEHINDLLNGVGNTEESAAARVLKRELTLIKESLYSDIEAAVPGFAKFRADYQRDSRAIDALQMLQDQRLKVLNPVTQHITPARWFRFMKDVVEGRADPFDPASSLSEDQMDRLWDISDQLKRQTLLDAGHPRGSWTNLMGEIGLRHAIKGVGKVAAAVLPGGRFGVELATEALKQRDVMQEADRFLNPPQGQGGP